MIALTAYFSTVSYIETVRNAEENALQHLDGIIQTFSLQVDQALTGSTGIQSIEDAKDEFTQKIILANRHNDLQYGLRMVLIDDHSGEVEFLGGDKTAEKAHRDALNYLIEKAPTTKTRFGTSEGEREEVFYAIPVSLLSGSSTRCYIFALESIENQLHEARLAFLQRIGLGILFLVAIIIIGVGSLKKMLRHEILSKQRLRDVAQLAEDRSTELETLSHVLSKCDNLIVLTDSAGKIEWVNESYSQKNNFTETEIESFVGRELQEVSHYPRIQEVIDRVVESGEKWEYESKSYDANKEEFWASTTVTPIFDKDDNVDRLIFVDADITRLKQAESKVAKLASFATETTRPLIRIRKDGLILFANQPGQKLLEHWNIHVNEKIEKRSIRASIERSLETASEQRINIELDNRILSMRFTPSEQGDYVNVAGEDITEQQIEKETAKLRFEELEQHQLSMTDSINYAKRIQEAILPNEDQMRKVFKDSFFWNQPKDIVSGDFFWVQEIVPNKEFLVALADCTGHGVPGAMMSIVGHGILNEIVENEGLKDPAEILRRLNKEVIKSLRQKTKGTTSDGMDISLAHINMETMEITYSGAFQTIYWMNGKLNAFKGDRQPIGGVQHDKNRTFTNHVFKVSKGDALYFTSDGFADQFGGPSNKKFRSSNLEDIIRQNHKYSMQAQSFIYQSIFKKWKGQNEQVDDVSVIGIRF